MAESDPAGVISNAVLPQHGGNQRHRKHVFIVDDQGVLLELMRALFQYEQYDVTTTSYVPHVFDHIDALQPDVILLDLAIGQRRGWDLLEHLHRVSSTLGIPVIVTSVSRTLLAEAQQDPNRFGQGQFIIKPFDLDILLAAVHEATSSVT